MPDKPLNLSAAHTTPELTKEALMKRTIGRLPSTAALFFRVPNISSLRAVNFGPGHSNPRIKRPRKARVVATPRRLAAVILAALFPAWPLPVCAQITPVTVADTEAGIVNITNANNALQTAIQAFAANPSATNAMALTTAQTNYNDAVAAANITRIMTPSTVVGSSWPVASGQASAIFAAPGGTLTFSGQPVLNNGLFFLGASAQASAAAFTFQGSGSPNAIGNVVASTATITNSSFKSNFDTAMLNTVAGSIVTIMNSSFSTNSAPHGAAVTNDGTAMIIGSSFSGNTSGFGGAIDNDGPMTIINSSFIDNIAHNNGNNALGGAIANSTGRGVVGDITLVVGPGQTSTFSGNTEDTGIPGGHQASSIFFDVGAGGLTVNLGAGGLLDMRDPMSGAPDSVSEMGQGVWALGGANEFSTSSTPPGGSRPTMFSVNSGMLYLYAEGEVPNGPGQVAAGSIALNASGSRFTLGTGATLVAGGANSITVNGDALLADGATIRGGTAADGSLVHVPLAGPVTSRLDLSATEGVGLQGQLTVKAVAPGDAFTLASSLANAPGSIGSLLVPGSGTVIQTGSSTYTGPTMVAAGTLRAGETNTFPMLSAFTVAGGATLDLNNFNQSIGSLAGAGSVTLGTGTLTTGNDNTSTTFAGIISGDGGLTKVGNGTLILTGENTFSGVATILGGALQLGNDGTGGSIDVNVDDGGTFTFDHSNTVTFHGVISGPGGLAQIGTGTTILTANNTFSGGTTIEDGTLVVGTPNAAQETSFALGTGNVFLGPGTLRTTSLETGRPLTINVGGNYAQGPAGTLALGIGGLQGEQFDHVQVGGNASLNGLLQVSSLSNFRPVAGNAFEVLHTNNVNGRSGQFSHIDDTLNNNPNLQRIDVYAPNAAVLIYAAAAPTPAPSPTPTPPVPPPGPTPTPTPKPPIEEVIPEPLPPVNPEAPFPPAEEIAILDPTAAQLTSLYQVGFTGAWLQRSNLDDRMFQLQQAYVPPPPPPPTPSYTKEGKAIAPPPAPAPSAPRFGVWASGYGDWTHVGTNLGYHFTTAGMSAGVDYLLTPHWAVGLFGGYSHNWINFKSNGSADSDTGLGGLYTTYFNPTGWWVNAAVWGGGTSYSTSRQALLGPANGSTNGWLISTYGEAGYDLHCGALSYGPIVAMQYTDTQVNGFTENGSLVPLSIHEDSQDSLVTDVGGRIYYNAHLGQMALIPQLKLAWEHEYLYSSLPITASAPTFGGATAVFHGPSIGHDSLVINAGVLWQVNPRIAVTVSYDGQLARDHYYSNGVDGVFSWSF
jgi:autotransporter-associated beta strand protein